MADYPVLDKKILTNEAWQKNKGTYAKAIGKTGLGEALIKLNSAYNAIEWPFLLDPPVLKKKEVLAMGKAKILERQRYAKKQGEQVAKLETQIENVLKVARATKTKFENSKLPNVKTGGKAVDAVIKSALALKSDVGEKPYKTFYNQWDSFVKDNAKDIK